RIEVPHRLDDNGRKLVTTIAKNVFELLDLIEVKRNRGSGELLRHAAGRKTRQQVTPERVLLEKVCGKIPIVPAVITAERDAISSGAGARDSHSHRERFATGARVAD